MSGQKNKRAKACDISSKVKMVVWERDGGACVICGCRSAAPNAHFISRAHGGMGIDQNVVTLCTGFGNGCHAKFDNGTRIQREEIRQLLRYYLMAQYPEWDESKLIYRRGTNDV